MKNRILISFAFCIFHLVLSAQPDQSKINKKAKEAFDKAYARYAYGDYPGAISLLKEAIKKDGKYVDAYMSLATIYKEMKNYEQSISNYEKGFQLDTSVYSGRYKLDYSVALAGLGRFGEALAAVNELLARPNLDERTIKTTEKRRNSYLFATEFQKKHAADQYTFSPKNLGEGVNTEDPEYFPTLPIEGDKIIFTRRVGGIDEDFYGSVKSGNKWGKSIRIDKINTPLNEAAQSISQDGRWLVFDACTRRDGYGSCDLYISYMTDNGWSAALNLGGIVNSEQWDVQPCLSPDKRDMYFTSTRPGGYGGSDIYVTHMQSDGRWSTPENLGPEVNTAADEACPFIHADNQTLYFTSNGHLGYGDMDIFLIRRVADGKWGKPENLGYPINTIENEGSLFIAADGKTAYYASDRREGKGAQDIYSFEMRPDIRPNKTLWIKGRVFDEKTSKGLPSTVELIDLASTQTISKVQTDETGNYLITLPVGKDYAFNVNRRNYLFYSDNYSLKDKSPDSTYLKNIPLQPIEVNAAIVLKNIFFDYNKFELKPESQVELDKLVQLMNDNPAVKIQVEGHTDNIGNAAENLRLSENRAKSVMNYLVSKSIKPERMLAKGFGATKPVADNSTEQGRGQNRRTEIKIIGK